MARVKPQTLFTFAPAGTESCTSTGLTLSSSATWLTEMQPGSTPPFYIDQKADSGQREALTAILQFMNGAYDSSPLQASQIKFVPMAFRESPDKTTYTLSIPGILDERTILRRDGSGKLLSNVTAMDAWSNFEHYADNVLFKYHDPELHREWDHSGGYANIKFFHLTKTMYDQKEMLGQFGDFSGRWTPEQLAIIHKQGLKE